MPTKRIDPEYPASWDKNSTMSSEQICRIRKYVRLEMMEKNSKKVGTGILAKAERFKQNEAICSCMGNEHMGCIRLKSVTFKRGSDLWLKQQEKRANDIAQVNPFSAWAQSLLFIIGVVLIDGVNFSMQSVFDANETQRIHVNLIFELGACRSVFSCISPIKWSSGAWGNHGTL